MALLRLAAATVTPTGSNSLVSFWSAATGGVRIRQVFEDDGNGHPGDPYPNGYINLGATQTALPAVYVDTELDGVWRQVGGSRTQVDVSSVIPDGSIVTADLADGAVTAGKLASGAAGMYDVRSYGAVGDNATAADGAAIQAAITAAPAGATIFLPPGSYKTTVTVQPKSNQTILGYGATLIPATNANLDAVLASPAAVSASATTFDTGIRVLGLKIDGNRANQTGGEGTGIRLAAGRSLLRDVFVTGTRGTGIILADVNGAGTLLTDTVTGVENRVESCMVMDSAGNGIQVLQSGNGKLTDGYLTNNLVGFSRHSGIRCDSAGGWHVTGNHVYASGLSGIIVQYGYATHVVDNYVEGVGALSASGLSTGTAIDLACTTYSAGTTYAKGEVAVYSSTLMISRVDGNTGNTPDTANITDYWQPSLLQGTNVACLAVIHTNSGRSTIVRGNHGSLGHASYGLHASMNYRGALYTGPNSGSTKGSIRSTDNDWLNEYQSAGTNTTAVRVSTTLGTGTGGVTLLDFRDNARGSWNAVKSLSSSSTPTVAAGANQGTGGSAQAIATDSSDMSGTGTFATGSSGSGAGVMCTVSFAAGTLSSAPTVLITPSDAATAALGLYAVPTTTGFAVRATSAPSSSTAYSYRYRVIRES